MKYIKNETGYALLLALLIITVFTVLGMSVLRMSLSGTERNYTREETVQANDLAIKGIDHITAQITNELNTLVSGAGISAESYLNSSKGLKATIDKYKCVGGTANITQNATPGTGSKYTVCINKIDPDPESKVMLNNKEEHLRRILTFKSTGISGGKTEIFYSKYNIGATQYPESLNYAVGAYKYTGVPDAVRFPNMDGEGNLLINGGVSIKGDIKVDSNLIISKHGIYPTSPNSPSTSRYNMEDSVPAQFVGVNGQTPKIYLGGALYNFIYQFRGGSTTNSIYQNYKDEKLGFNNSNYFNENFVNADVYYDGIAPERITYTNEIKPINFNKKLEQLKVEAKKPNSKVMISEKSYSISGTKTLQGIAYIRGDLDISNADLQNDIILYVEGDVSISDSKINGFRKPDGTFGSLIIFAKGNINLIENSLYSSTPSRIKGYFYSEKEMELYGVYSNIEITGGISARKIVLNALRGNWTTSWFGLVRSPPTEFEQKRSSSKSRLDIIYDEDIIKNYSELEIASEPWIDNISPPVELERSYTPPN